MEFPKNTTYQVTSPENLLSIIGQWITTESFRITSIIFFTPSAIVGRAK